MVNNELIIQILSTLPNNQEVFTNCLMYQIVLMPSFAKLTTMMLSQELCYEIKDIHKVEHEGLNVNHYIKCNEPHSYEPKGMDTFVIVIAKATSQCDPISWFLLDRLMETKALVNMVVVNVMP
jgi:hypothetical protein